MSYTYNTGPIKNLRARGTFGDTKSIRFLYIIKGISD